MTQPPTSELLPPSPYPNQTGAGERLKTLLLSHLPEVLRVMQANSPNPMVSAVLSSAPMLMGRIELTDEQAVQIAEGLDDFTTLIFRDVLGVVAE